MIYSGTEIKTNDGSCSIEDLLEYIKDSSDFKELSKKLQEVLVLKTAMGKAIKIIQKTDPSIMQSDGGTIAELNKSLKTKVELSDIIGFKKYNELLKSLITKVAQSLEDKVAKLPNQKGDLSPIIQALKDEFDIKTTNLEDSINEAKITLGHRSEKGFSAINKKHAALNKKVKDLISVVDELLDKTEGEVDAVHNQLNAKIKDLQEAKKKAMSIVGGVNPALNKLLKLQDVNGGVNGANAVDGVTLRYNGITKKFDLVPLIAGDSFTIQDSDLTLSDSNKNTIFNNKGAASVTNFTVDAGASAGSGWEVEVGQDTNGIKVIAGGTRVITISGAQTAAGGFIKSLLRGAVAKIIVVDATEILVRYSTRTWKIDS